MKKKGTIIYIGGFQLPDKNAAAHRVISNAKIIRELGYDVVLIGVDEDLDYGFNVLDTKLVIQGFDSWSIPYPKAKIHWIHYLANINYFKKIVSLYEDVKFVICYNYQALAFIKMKRFCKKNSIKIIGDCTEWYSIKGSNLSYKILKGFDVFIRMRVIHKYLDGLIVISKYLESYYSKCKNVICVPPLVDKSELKWKNQYINEVNDKITIVYAGSPGNKDKINYIIEAMYSINEPFKLNLIGITKNEYLRINPQHSELLQFLKGNIQFSGRLSHLETIECIKKADFFCFFRDQNVVSMAGFPTKFGESISCGIPVITNKTSDLSDYLIDSVNGYFIEIDSIKSIRTEMLNLIKLNTNKILQMKEYCYTSNLFDYKDYINLFEEIFE